MQISFCKAGRDFFKVRFWVGNRSGGKTSRDFVPQKVDLQAGNETNLGFYGEPLRIPQQVEILLMHTFSIAGSEVTNS